MKMNKMASRNNTYLLMKMKVLKPNDRVASLGLMSVEDVASKLMHGQSSLESIQFAINQLCCEGLLDAYYQDRCGSCKARLNILERDFLAKETLKAFAIGNEFCPTCSREVDLSGDQCLYAIPNSTLQKVEEPSHTASTFLSRFRKWLRREKN